MHRPGVDFHSQQPPEPTGIVSVNSRGGNSKGMTAKLAFAVVAAILMVVGVAMTAGRYLQSKKAQDAAAKLAAGANATAADSGKRHIFNTDPPPLPGAASAKTAALAAPQTGACVGGRPLLGPDGQPMIAPSGQPLRVCANGQVIVPAPGASAADDVPSIPVLPNTGTIPPHPPTRAPSRFGGDVLLHGNKAAEGSATPDPQNPYIQALLRASSSSIGTEPAIPALPFLPSSPAAASASPIATNPPGGDHKAVAATMIGDRDMILPEGRTIDCNLSVRVINQVSGRATCILSSNVYSDSGRVVLAERGSTAVGEYVAATAQGQRRLFVLWTRLQTPNGVVINVNSPGADALGTSGLPGEVDNRWPERIGAAVLLSLVEDAIGYETAKAASADGGGAQGVAVFQSTTQTGRSLAERILDSTINIKPTIYKNQGDRATIFVSRDLDFGSVYALRAK